MCTTTTQQYTTVVPCFLRTIWIIGKEPSLPEIGFPQNHHLFFASQSYFHWSTAMPNHLSTMANCSHLRRTQQRQPQRQPQHQLQQCVI